MNFWEHFIRLLPHRPADALAALYWNVTRRRVRARNRLRAASADLPFAYDIWIQKVERDSAKATSFAEEAQRLSWRPTFGVLVHGSESCTAQETEATIKSVRRQRYAATAVMNIASDKWSAALDAAKTDYTIPLRVGDTLSEGALFRFAQALQADPRPAIVYGDEDQLDGGGQRRRPWFKPRWNQEMFLAQDYLSSAVAIRTSLARASCEANCHSLDGLLLAATSDSDGPIVHVPNIITHVNSRPNRRSPAERLAAVRRYVEVRGGEASPGLFGTVKVSWPLPSELPMVSIIVPTRDKLDLLRPCLDGVLSKTDYTNFEILVLDNDSVDERTHEYLQQLSQDHRVRILPFAGPYNFSSFNNFAARQVRGSFLCLLNNDTEVVEPTWLTEMMRYAVRPDVGAVGAKLLYGDGTIQHAGVVIGLGEAAGHAHRFLRANDPGYFRMPHVTQFISAVTAACLVVDKKKFLAVGGLDEGLAVAFNDVDFCLKLEAAGWRNVYVPHAVLVHHESKSRGKDTAPRNMARYMRELAVLQERWGTKTYNDPLHHPSLDRYSETFTLRL